MGADGRARAPLAALALVLLATYAAFVLSGRARVKTDRDDGYIEASHLPTLTEVLSHQRTFAYPLLLRGVRALTPGYEALPHLQALLFLLSIPLLWRALVAYRLPPWTAFFATAPLAGSELVLPFARLVHSDTVGGAAAVACAAALFAALARPRLLAWTGLGLAVFLTIQVRPAYLFLAALVPLLAAILEARSGGAPERTSPLRRGRAALLACGLPLLGFSALRWLLVGHFGLVSFGGFNVVGIAASMLSPAVVAELPTDIRPLGQAILDGRTERGLTPIAERPARGVTARFVAWYDEYNSNSWAIASRVAYPAARARYRALRAGLRRELARLPAGADPDVARRRAELQEELAGLGDIRPWAHREANRLLTELSHAVFAARPGLYGAWIFHGLRLGTAWTVREVRGVAPTLAAAATAAIAAGALAWAAAAARRARCRAALAAAVRRSEPLLWLAGGFFASGLALVVLVEPPAERYLFSVALFLPGAFAALAWELLAAAAAARRDRALPAETERAGSMASC